MSLWLQNPNHCQWLPYRWLQQPWFIALLINFALVWLMYWLTLGNQKVDRVHSIHLSTVFHARPFEHMEPEQDQSVDVSQAPQSASMPPPPTILNLSTLAFDSSVSLPNMKVPIETNKPDLQIVNLTFSPQGNGVGSMISSAMAQAKPVIQIPPRYPAKAKRDGIEGFVTLDLYLDQEGRAQEIKVVAEEPPGVFARSAKRAVIRWRFMAPEEKQWQRITIRYELET
ncbi:energy transducer TonB [Vibrio sp.]|uniref:energy transducer TonB n=1 Tax=Vibrio sp. TaxID=678 RepID=UPI003D096EB0